SNPLVIVGRHVNHGREYGRHRVVDPDVDRTEGCLRSLRGILGGGWVGDVTCNNQRLAAKILDFPSGVLEALAATGDQTEVRAAACKRPHDRAPKARAGARDHYDFSLVRSGHAFAVVASPLGGAATS